MADERACIDVPNYGDAMTFEILLRGLTRSPIRSKSRELTDDQRFDVGLRRFLIVEVRAYIADMGIRQAHSLPGIAGIGENFLVAGKTGIENDFATAAGSSASRTTVKNSSVLERERRATCEGLVQCVLQKMSF